MKDDTVEVPREVLREVRNNLRQSLVENDSGDKHNDYDGLYFDMEQALANLNALLGDG